MKYSPQLVKLTEEWISENGLMDYGGARLKDLYSFLGCDKKTYYNWKDRYPEFRKAIEKGKEEYKSTVATDNIKSLFKAAKGGERKETEITTEYIPVEGSEKPKIRRMIKKERTVYIKPDVAAAIFIACNLDPEHWQNKMRNDISFKKPSEDNDMSLDEIKAEIARLSEKE